MVKTMWRVGYTDGHNVYHEDFRDETEARRFQEEIGEDGYDTQIFMI
jgi:hypothetical protein